MKSTLLPTRAASSDPRCFTVDRLEVEVHRDDVALARAASRDAAAHLQAAIQSRGHARVIFGCAPSQDRFLDALLDPAICGQQVNWSLVTVFHMDDYVGLPEAHPQSFRTYLRRHFLDHAQVGAFHPITAELPDSDAVCAAYTELLRASPIDLVCLGIGENGHIAFNDPAAADFADPKLVKVIKLDPICRQQQVNDGCFPHLEAVPRSAITITITVFREARRLCGIVPGRRKAAAVRAALEDPISTACPATIVRTHPSARVFLDPASASLLVPS